MTVQTRPAPGGGTGADLAARQAVIQAGRVRAGDMLKQMNTSNLYHEAIRRGMSLTAFLETEDPSSNYDDGLDAFSRMLQVAEIKTRSLPDWGISCDTFGEFWKTPYTRGLVPEWIQRQWKRVSQASLMPRVTAEGKRSPYLADDSAPGSILQPYFDSPTIHTPALQAAIPLASLIAQTTQITGTLYRALYMADTTAEERMVRVTELAEIPEAKLLTGQHNVNLFKYGRAITASYETLRDAPIDRIAFHLQRLALQTEIDKVATVLDILINGDGNANTSATSYNLTTLDPAATAGTLTLKGWLAFKMKYQNPYTPVVALAQEATALQMMLLNLGSANVPLVTVNQQAGFGSFTPINPGLADNVRLGWTADAPTLKIVGVDTRLAVERITQIGSNIQETDRYITNQSQKLVITEIEGYAIMDQAATKILDVNA